MVAVARGLGCRREDRADHDGVGATGEGLGDVAAEAHATVGDDGHAVAAAAQVVVTRGGAVAGCSDLGHADTQHRARRARRTGTDTDEQPFDAGVHELERRRVIDAVAGDHGDVDRLGEVAE